MPYVTIATETGLLNNHQQERMQDIISCIMNYYDPKHRFNANDIRIITARNNSKSKEDILVQILCNFYFARFWHREKIAKQIRILIQTETSQSVSVYFLPCFITSFSASEL